MRKNTENITAAVQSAFLHLHLYFGLSQCILLTRSSRIRHLCFVRLASDIFYKAFVNWIEFLRSLVKSTCVRQS